MGISNSFKSNILKFGKLISIRITFDNGLIFEKEDISSCSKGFEGSLFKTVMQFVDIELIGIVDVRSKTFLLEFGVKAEEKDSYEYINWGRFIVDNNTIENKMDKNSTSFTAYDYLKLADTLYKELELDYPITLGDYLNALCDVLGYILITKQFVNSDTVLYDDRFIGVIKYTYRDVLDNIAGSTGGIILLRGNELSIKYPTDINYVINRNNLKTMSVLKKFGPINSMAQSDGSSIKRIQDEESIRENGVNEVKFINNSIINSYGNAFSENLFNQINGLNLYCFQLDSFGFGFFEPLDIVTVEDRGISYKTMILSNTITITTGITETIQTNIESPFDIDYTKTNDVQALIKDTTKDLKDAVYYFTNNETIQLGNTEVEIIRIEFTSKSEASTPLFNANIVFKIESSGLLEFTYILDNINYHVHPKQTVMTGYFTIHLFLPMYQLKGNISHDLIVTVKSDTAMGSISRNQIQATVNGQGLEVLKNDWDGKLSISETFDQFTINSEFNTVQFDFIDNGPTFKYGEVVKHTIEDVFKSLLIEGGDNVILKEFSDRVTTGNEVVSATLSTEYKENLVYSSFYVEDTEQFKVREDYIGNATVETVDVGRLMSFSIDSTLFEEITGILLEVKNEL